MTRLLLLAALLASACADTCEECVRRCAPFAVSKCEPRRDWATVDCSCDVSRKADQ